jgi:hypothetical protein
MALLTNDHLTVPAVAPSAAVRLRLEPTRWSHRMMLDGCWWPNSADPVAELPDLVSALDKLHGPITRMLLSAAGWSRRPHGVDVAGRMVSLGYFSDQPVTLLTASCAGGDSISLQVVPSATPREAGTDGQPGAETVPGEPVG